jgi:hypothetical protein
MGIDGACGLLFCAAKRSGTFPPNMPQGTYLPPSVIEKIYLQNQAKLTQNWNSKSFKNPLNPFQNPFS